MNQAEISKLMSQLRVRAPERLRRLKNPDGPEGRLLKLRKTVTALIKHERIEVNHHKGHETRLYAERLISDAIRYGDCHKTTMEMADYWLLEKQLVHKLFKVLVPRFQNYSVAYTRIFRAPIQYNMNSTDYNVLLELRGNPYPPLVTDTTSNRNMIHNVLLDEAKKEYREMKYQEIADKIEKAASAANVSLGSEKKVENTSEVKGV